MARCYHLTSYLGTLLLLLMDKNILTNMTKSS